MIKRTVISLLTALTVFSSTTLALELESRDNINPDKEWKVTFNRVIKGLNEKEIRVLNEDNEEVEVKVTLNDEKSILIKPLNNYKSGSTYTLNIGKGINTVEEMNDNVSMKFTIENKDITNEEKTDSIFLQPNLSDYFSTERSYIEGKELVFNYDDTEGKHYKLNSPINPSLNETMYNLSKYLLENNEKGNYIKTFYLTPGILETSVTGLIFTASKEHEVVLFDVTFYESDYNEFNGANMSIQMRQLSDPKHVQEGVKKGVTDLEEQIKLFYYQEHYVNKFKECIKIIFEDKDHEEIYNYIMKLYDDKAHGELSKASKTIDGVTVFCDYKGGWFDIYFKY